MRTKSRIKEYLCFALCIWAALLFFGLKHACAQQPAGNEPFKQGAAADKSLLSEEQIAALQTDWTNPKTGDKLQFQASFGVRNLTPQEKTRYAKSGKIPYRITCALYEIKDVGGKKRLMRVNGGTARFYITDPDGKVVEKKSMPLDKMCPS